MTTLRLLGAALLAAFQRLDHVAIMLRIGITALAVYPALRFAVLALSEDYGPTPLDELLALALLPLAIWTLRRGETLQRIITVGFGIYALFGLLGALVHRNQGLSQPLAALYDIALDAKLLIILLGATAIFREASKPERLMHRAAWLVVILALLNAPFVLRDLLCEEGISLRGEPLLPRLGFFQPHGLLGHHLESLWLSFTAALAAFYLARVSEQRSIMMLAAGLSALVLAHLSVKEGLALLAGASIVLLDRPVMRADMAVRVPLAICAAFAVWTLTPLGELTVRQLETYTGTAGRPTQVRTILTRESFVIAQQFFPLGSGAGSYASPPSFQFGYSDVYVRHGLSGLWGASANTGNHLLDVFWPKVIAQSGFVGAVFYLVTILLMGRPAVRAYLETGTAEASLAVGMLVSMLIISVAATPFTHEWLAPVLATTLAFHMSLLRRPGAPTRRRGLQ